jgi:hypothetical protein
MDEETKNQKQADLAAEKIRRRRSIAIALTLAFMVFAFYVATFVRLGGNAMNGIR